MSGYLQRLVSSVRTPSTTIRAVLGSLYSYPAYFGAAEGLHEVGQTVVSREPDVMATPSPSPPHGLPPPQKSRSPRSAASHVEPRVAVPQTAVSGSNDEALQGTQESSLGGQSETPKPFIETPASFTALVSETHPQQRPSLKADFAGSPTIELSEDGVRPLAGPSQELTPRRPYRPLVPEDLRRPGPSLLRNPSMLTPDRGSIEKTGPARHSVPLERSADDIQIHIGRIEVTAVPPAPTRPAVQPVRKSLRLDEYLRRGREGAR